MIQQETIAEYKVHKKGKHLTLDARGMIQFLHNTGHSLRSIAGKIGCSPSTVLNELRRGTPIKHGNIGRNPIYTAKRGQEAYERNRKNSHRSYKYCIGQYMNFFRWMAVQIKDDKWSIDVCIGHAKRSNKFKDLQLPTTKTVYNMLHRNLLPFSVFDVPYVLKRVKNKSKIKVVMMQRKHNFGKSIDERLEIVTKRNEFGHWEGDTVIGKRKKESVVFILVELFTENYISIKIPGKTTLGVDYAMRLLQDIFGREKFKEVFKTITVDNGSEFDDFTRYEKLGATIYYAHPYSSYERPHNERTNGMLRRFIPKGKSIDNYSEEEILSFSDMINAIPRKSLGYRTPKELFEKCLDEIYSK